MAINLSDIRAAVVAYLNSSVTVSVTAPVPDQPTVISPDEGFTYSVKATNASAAAGGVQLTGVVYHVRLTPASVAKLQVPASPPARAVNSPAGPTLAPGSMVSEMFLFPTSSSAHKILAVGESDTITGLRGKALDPGAATIRADIQANIDENWLFPNQENTPSGSRTFNVL